MKRKTMQECPVYKNKNDIIDFWLYEKKDEKSCIGIAKVSMEEINASVAYGYNVDEDGGMVVNIPQAKLIKCVYFECIKD